MSDLKIKKYPKDDLVILRVGDTSQRLCLSKLKEQLSDPDTLALEMSKIQYKSR